MAYVANTRAGVIRRGYRQGEHIYLLQCPNCSLWIELDQDRWHGRLAVDHITRWCPGYTQTRNFAAIVEAAGGFRAV